MDELQREYEMFDEVFEDMGDISRSVVLDIGSGGGSLASYLVKKKGLERVFAIDLFTGTSGLLGEKLSSEELLKVILVKADLRRLDFLKNSFFDLVTAYWTLSVVEKFTPGGTGYVLSEVYRILKPKASFIAIEHRPTGWIKPVDKAQRVWVRFLEFSNRLAGALGEPVGLEYTPQSLMETLENAGLKVSHWKETKATFLNTELSDTLSYTKKRFRKISDDKLRNELLREMTEIELEVRKHGMRNIPDYAVYAVKPAYPKRRKVRLMALAELYNTVHHKDILGYE